MAAANAEGINSSASARASFMGVDAYVAASGGSSQPLPNLVPIQKAIDFDELGICSLTVTVSLDLNAAPLPPPPPI